MSRVQSAFFVSCLGLIAWALVGSASAQQQVNVQVPFRAPSNSFFEQTGTNWSLGGRNFFRFGGGPAVPPFGNPQPGAGVMGGGAINGRGVSGGFGFTASQGSQRSNVSQSGNLTMFDGYPGFLSDTSQTPFVTGLIPVVGEGKPPWLQQFDGDVPKQARDTPAPATAVKQDGINARAAADDPGRFSLEELRRQQTAADSAREKEVAEQLAKARDAVTAGKPNVARIYYQMAVRRAEGELKQRVLVELKGLDAERAAPPQ